MNYREIKINNLRERLVSIGCAYALRTPAIPQFPEETIVEGLNYFFEDKSILTMTVGVVEYRLHSLLNIEKLISLAKNSDPNSRVLIRYLSQRLVLQGHKRFQYILNELKSYKQDKIEVPESYTKKRLLKLWGEDPAFKKLGYVAANFFNEKPGKFYELGMILKMNPWLRIRSVAGPTHKADICYLKATKQVRCPQDVVKRLQCQRATAYNLWREMAHTPFIEDSDFFKKVIQPNFLIKNGLTGL